MTPLRDMDSCEREAHLKGYRLTAGVDEAGRGPLAGPVVAAAVILPYPSFIPGIDDSKRLTPEKRDSLVFEIFREAIAVGVGVVWTDDVDRMNILRASLLAMERAVRALKPQPDFLLIDGPRTIALPVPQRAVVSGDRKSITIASASIIAKTTRDRIMHAYHRLYPSFNFSKHKGYPTAEHISAIESNGLTPIHRKTFNWRGRRRA